jgi:hypothetical protein
MDEITKATDDLIDETRRRQGADVQDARSTESRTRGALEIITAILLGLVSVATAFGAYQAGQWGRKRRTSRVPPSRCGTGTSLCSSRPRSLRGRYRAALRRTGAQREATFYPERTERLMAERDVIIAAASPALIDAWEVWEGCGYCLDQVPLNAPQYEARHVRRDAVVQPGVGRGLHVGGTPARSARTR